MPRDDSTYLVDMLVQARYAREFVSGLTFSQFRQSPLHRLAVLKAVEIIGEAATRMSLETKQAHPEIPWPKMIGMRNRIVHAYFAVELETLWRVVQDDLPVLIGQLEPLVQPETD